MNEWTIMFYVAGDNALAPLLVSQLKAITDAGFQENTSVLVHFDPNEMGVPTRIYDVNHERKKKSSRKTIIGDGRDPFVRSLDRDDIQGETMDSSVGPVTMKLRERLIFGRTDDVNAEKALELFLGFCRESHPANHYMLFLIGHGLVVGNDAFLPDDHPVSAITLKKLGNILKDFTSDIKETYSTFELVGLHSCSMSAIEVAYELKGTAKRGTARFMMASEGPAFTDSWPYRQLLKKIFNNTEKAEKKGASNPSINIPKLVESLFNLTFFNAVDFLAAGYSQDLALCSLEPEDFKGVTRSIKSLVVKLNEGLDATRAADGSDNAERGRRMKELVLLAHLEAQSYWGETYTDLHDFCRCLSKRCEEEDRLTDLGEACEKVIENLKAIVLRSKSLGSNVQYSHGLSIYFPWSKPIDDVEKRRKQWGAIQFQEYADKKQGILDRYAKYAFTTDLGDNPWLSFLKSYFELTQRTDRMVEDQEDGVEVGRAHGESTTPFGALSGTTLNGRPIDKPSPDVGAACTCPSIKNYPPEPKDKVSETLTRSQRKR